MLILLEHCGIEGIIRFMKGTWLTHLLCFIMLCKNVIHIKMLCYQLISSNVAAPPQTVKWELPPVDWIKINWDVATQKDANKIGIGVVIRDNEGAVLMSVMKPMYYCTDATSAEVRGLFEAVGLCKEFGSSACMLEGDSLQVVNAVNQHNGEDGV